MNTMPKVDIQQQAPQCRASSAGGADVDNEDDPNQGRRAESEPKHRESQIRGPHVPPHHADHASRSLSSEASRQKP
jgi:hypothetical protein